VGVNKYALNFAWLPTARYTRRYAAMPPLAVTSDQKI
jgi:hypothetical protein